MSTSITQRIRLGEFTVGTFVNIGSPVAAEACALAGFDWLLFDLEHGSGSEAALGPQILAAATHGVPALVRVESDQRIRTGRVLDLGATGIMFPRLDTREQVAEAIRHLRYPPDGDRGVATYNRACGFALHPEVLTTANDTIVGIVQIESLAALSDVKGIAATPGVDVLFVGPADLSFALGVPGQLESPEFQSAIDRVLAGVDGAGKVAGILAGSHVAAQRYRQLGFKFVAIGSDSTMLAAAARSAALALTSPTTLPGSLSGREPTHEGG